MAKKKSSIRNKWSKGNKYAKNHLLITDLILIYRVSYEVMPCLIDSLTPGIY